MIDFTRPRARLTLSLIAITRFHGTRSRYQRFSNPIYRLSSRDFQLLNNVIHIAANDARFTHRRIDFNAIVNRTEGEVPTWHAAPSEMHVNAPL